jgi:hypothetical protein
MHAIDTVQGRNVHDKVGEKVLGWSGGVLEYCRGVRLLTRAALFWVGKLFLRL